MFEIIKVSDFVYSGLTIEKLDIYSSNYFINASKQLYFFDVNGENIVNTINQETYISYKNYLMREPEIYLNDFFSFDFFHIDLSEIKELTDFLFPHLKLSFSEIRKIYLRTNYSDYSKKLLETFNYTGNATSGLIFTEGKDCYIISSNHKYHPIFYLLENVRKFFYPIQGSPIGHQTMYDTFIGNLEDSLKPDEIKYLKEIVQRIDKLDKNGSLSMVLPVLEEKIKKMKPSLDIRKLSDIIIDDEYKIFLPYFDNMELPMSDLTKVVYIFFVKKPGGFDIKNLSSQKNELMKIYLNISSKTDFDKMVKSIDDLIDLKTKAIFTHFSRIKSLFYKIMNKRFAEQYIIVSEVHGNTYKYIPYLKTKFVKKNQENFKKLADGISTIDGAETEFKRLFGKENNEIEKDNTPDPDTFFL